MPVVNSTKVPLIALANEISGALVRAYHEKVIAKRRKTVKVLSVSSNLGFNLEMMKTRATIAK
jgi:hypothetical protein